jgi:SAM-dependent methyltransferase/putative flippase GtrA
MADLPSAEAAQGIAPATKTRRLCQRRRMPLQKNIRYLAVVTICAIANNILLISLVKSGFDYFAGILLSYFPMILLGYFLHVSVTFEARPSLTAFGCYGVAMLANYPLWIGSLFVLSDLLRLPIVMAAPIGTAITFLGNYIATHWAILRSTGTAFRHAGPPEKRSVDQRLFAQLLSAYAFQPATALWRAVELPALIGLGIPMGRGIDIGCGDGKLTAIVLGSIGERELVGVDPDPEEAAEAARRNIYSAVHAVDASGIPEPDAGLDFAISNSVLEHIPDLGTVLTETARVIRPNGLFLLTVPHVGFHAQLRGPLLPGTTRDAYERRLDVRLAHLRYPSAAEWTTMLDQHGFTTEAIEFYLSRSQVRRWETISRFTAGALSALCSGHQHPITLQRRLGLRKLQNARALPHFVASLLATILMFGLGNDSSNLTEATTGCVAIRCRRRPNLA